MITPSSHRTHLTQSNLLTPRERLLWTLRDRANLSVSEILALRWRHFGENAGGNAELRAALAAYRDSLGGKTFLLEADAPVFTSRNRGRGGRRVSINRWQVNHLLAQVRRKLLQSKSPAD